MAEASTQVHLEGDCGVERAAEIRERFRAALDEEANCVELDLSAVTRADVSLQQIVCAAHRSFSRRGARLVLSANPAEAVREIQQDGGFGRVCMFRREQCPFQGGSRDE